MVKILLSLYEIKGYAEALMNNREDLYHEDIEYIAKKTEQAINLVQEGELDEKKV